MVPPSLLAGKKRVLSLDILFDGVADNPGNGHFFLFGDALNLRIEIAGESHGCASSFL